MMKKTEKWLKPWYMGTHLRVLIQPELSNEYQHDRVYILFKTCFIVLCAKVALALEGLRMLLSDHGLSVCLARITTGRSNLKIAVFR